MLIEAQSIIKNEINEAKLEEFSRFTKIYKKPTQILPVREDFLTFFLRKNLRLTIIKKHFLLFPTIRGNGQNGLHQAVVDTPIPDCEAHY